MIGMDTKTVNNFGKIAKAADKAAFRNLGHAAAAIRKTAVSLPQYSKEITGYRYLRNAKGHVRRTRIYRSSPPGQVPLRHKGAGYYRAGILFDATKDDAVTGPTRSAFGKAFWLHEHGGTSEAGYHYPPRPLMGPAMDANLDRFASQWEGSITE